MRELRYKATTGRQQVAMLSLPYQASCMGQEAQGVQSRASNGARQTGLDSPCNLLASLTRCRMNWLNIPIASLRKPEFTACGLADLGIWLRLSCYCAAQENGGRILNCKKWTDRQWLIACGVTAEDVSHECDLWVWQLQALMVANYPKDKEKEVAAKRAAGKATAKARWGRRIAKLEPPERKLNGSSAHSSAISSADSSPHAEEEMEVEGKGKEVHTPRVIRIVRP